MDVTDDILTTEAERLARQLGISSEDFSASHGFISRFKARHQVSLRTKAGEGREAAADHNIDQWLHDVLPTLIEGYEPKNIFNADETALFYRLLPHHTLAFRGEKCQGGKKKKERLSVLLAANMDGSEKLVPLVIGHYKNPRCFKNARSLPVTYKHPKNAWMTGALFKEWLMNFNQEMAKMKRKVLLFLDNCSAHSAATLTANFSHLTIH
ncbi:tigger transposable element-derived protein 6-like [Sycon ciliatum]|uniref:tigger transposable element-derived protein 6-like n=1 Tax=Sycon ciliatum TaxID=27933 RepID=UPI0031F6B207